jgi:hypothetical protein
MGRVIRKVPEKWSHPVTKDGKFIPMYEYSYIDTLNEWIKNHNLWMDKLHPEQDDDYEFYAEYAGDPPDIEHYNNYYKKEDATWFQCYENVSEGTPVTPAFETEKELVDYLVEFGELYGTKYNTKYSREAVEKFVYEDKICFSGAFCNGEIKRNIESLIL